MFEQIEALGVLEPDASFGIPATSHHIAFGIELHLENHNPVESRQLPVLHVGERGMEDAAILAGIIPFADIHVAGFVSNQIANLMVFIQFHASKVPGRATVEGVVHLTIGRPHHHGIVGDCLYSTYIIHRAGGHDRGFVPGVAAVVGILKVGVIGWRHEDAALGTEGDALIHVIVVDLFPRYAFVVRADEAAIAGHGKEVAIGGRAEERAVAGDGFPDVLSHEAGKAETEN